MPVLNRAAPLTHPVHHCYHHHHQTSQPLPGGRRARQAARRGSAGRNARLQRRSAGARRPATAVSAVTTFALRPAGGQAGRRCAVGAAALWGAAPGPERPIDGRVYRERRPELPSPPARAGADPTATRSLETEDGAGSWRGVPQETGDSTLATEGSGAGGVRSGKRRLGSQSANQLVFWRREGGVSRYPLTSVCGRGSSVNLRESETSQLNYG